MSKEVIYIDRKAPIYDILKENNIKEFKMLYNTTKKPAGYYYIACNDTLVIVNNASNTTETFCWKIKDYYKPNLRIQRDKFIALIKLLYSEYGIPQYVIAQILGISTGYLSTIIFKYDIPKKIRSKTKARKFKRKENKDDNSTT